MAHFCFVFNHLHSWWLHCSVLTEAMIVQRVYDAQLNQCMWKRLHSLLTHFTAVVSLSIGDQRWLKWTGSGSWGEWTWILRFSFAIENIQNLRLLRGVSEEVMLQILYVLLHILKGMRLQFSTHLNSILESCFLSHLTGGRSFWDLFGRGGYHVWRPQHSLTVPLKYAKECPSWRVPFFRDKMAAQLSPPPSFFHECSSRKLTEKQTVVLKWHPCVSPENGLPGPYSLCKGTFCF